MQRTLPIREFKLASRLLKRDQQAEPDKLLRMWLSIGYTPSSVVAEPGTFNRRAGIIDVFPINAETPVRIEFFGDTVDSLRPFDPATQRSVGSLTQLVIPPAREALPKFGEDVAQLLYDWFDQQPLADDDVTSAQNDEHDLDSASAFPLIEFYLPYFYHQTASLLDYLSDDTLVIVEDWNALSETIGEMETQAIQQRSEKLAANQIPPSYPLPYFTWDELQKSLIERHPLHLASRDSADLVDDAPQLSGSLTPGAHYGGQLRTLLDALHWLDMNGDRVVVVSNQALRLAELWDEYNPSFNTTPLLELNTLPDGVTFIEGTLTEGWTAKDDAGRSTHLLTDAEIFGWKRHEPRQHQLPRRAAPETNFADLSIGDFVVHVEYGIGRFAGLRKQVWTATNANI